MSKMKKAWKWFALILCICAYLMRVFYLDADVRAPWGVLNYQPFDEGAYGALALNKIDFGTIDPNIYYDGEYEYEMQAHVISNVVGNVIIYPFLLVAGDNFWGFRLGIVFTGFLVLALSYLILKELRKRYSNSKNYLLEIVVAITILFSFVYYNACRIVEPTIFRVLFIQLICYIYIKKNIPDIWRYALIGFLAVASIFLVYSTNTFVVLALAMVFLFYLAHRECKKAFVLLGGCALGGFIAYIISFAYYFYYWDTFPITNIFNAISSFQQIDGYSITENQFLSHAIAFISSNIFLYSLPLIGLFLWALPFFIKTIFKKKDENILFFLSLILALFLQTLVAEDYIVRKSLLIYFAIIYLVYIWVLTDTEKLKTISIWNILKGSIITALLIYVYVYRLYLIEDLTNLDFTPSDKLILLMMLVAAVFVIFCLSAMKGINSKWSKGVILLSIAGMIFGNCLFIFKYNLYKNTYTDKAIMQDLGTYADDEIVAFSYSNNNTLYNDLLPLLATEDTILEYMTENPDIMYYGFDNFKNFNSDPNSLNQNIDMIVEYDREFQTFGVKRGFALYRYSEGTN